ncbi:MAG: ketoacyl-ACP synthase III [Bdellovibrionota bacterium]
MKKLLGLQAIATYVPEGRADLTASVIQNPHWNIAADFLKKKTGFLKTARKMPGEHALDLAMGAFVRLQENIKLDPSSVDLIVVVTQNPASRLPHLSALLQDKLGMRPDCSAFDISLGCSGYVHGLAIALAFMKDQGMRKALLFTADPYSEIVDPDDRDTALLFGDAASVSLLSDTPIWECGKFSFRTEGKWSEALKLENGKLKMDGLGVFNFAARQVPQEIEKVLKLNGLGIDDIDSFLLHSGSRTIVDSIAQRAGLPIEKCPFVDENIGNTVSSSIPLLLEAVPPSSRTVLLAGFGVGLASAATVVRRV